MDKFPYHKGRRWIQVLQTKDKAQRQAIIRGIFENGGFDATVDFPPCALADDLAAMYPDAKVSSWYPPCVHPLLCQNAILTITYNSSFSLFANLQKHGVHPSTAPSA